MTASTDACDANGSMLRARIGVPPTESSCFGPAPPKRWPRPPAAMIAVTCILYMLSACELALLDRGRDDGVHLVGELLGIARRRRVERRRLNGILHDQCDLVLQRLDASLVPRL